MILACHAPRATLPVPAVVLSLDVRYRVGTRWPPMVMTVRLASHKQGGPFFWLVLHPKAG